MTKKKQNKIILGVCSSVGLLFLSWICLNGIRTEINKTEITNIKERIDKVEYSIHNIKNTTDEIKINVAEANIKLDMLINKENNKVIAMEMVK